MKSDDITKILYFRTIFPNDSPSESFGSIQSVARKISYFPVSHNRAAVVMTRKTGGLSANDGLRGCVFC
ncbi:hypothetical protein ZOD2009_04757 [Haladaptatus paucihalophilus DX253]|uniref:Uncharacterized protein n=1 Tax=Haladaptatus paucihalophilus DX253 TaxID=797209 RepID=E7QQ81_HALPU|nr:hypothetical protein ZOD2009_04757 [Haladaptatus paucihalophilus DX253]